MQSVAAIFKKPISAENARVSFYRELRRAVRSQHILQKRLTKIDSDVSLKKSQVNAPWIHGVFPMNSRHPVGAEFTGSEPDVMATRRRRERHSSEWIQYNH